MQSAAGSVPRVMARNTHIFPWLSKLHISEHHTVGAARAGNRNYGIEEERNALISQRLSVQVEGASIAHAYMQGCIDCIKHLRHGLLCTHRLTSWSVPGGTNQE